MCHRSHTASCSHAVTTVLSFLTVSCTVAAGEKFFCMLGSSLDQSDEMLGADSVVIGSSITARYVY